MTHSSAALSADAFLLDEAEACAKVWLCWREGWGRENGREEEEKGGGEMERRCIGARGVVERMRRLRVFEYGRGT